MKLSRSSSKPVPVMPGDLIVLAVGVVVAALGAAGLVPAEQHCGPLFWCALLDWAKDSCRERRQCLAMRLTWWG